MMNRKFYIPLAVAAALILTLVGRADEPQRGRNNRIKESAKVPANDQRERGPGNRGGGRGMPHEAHQAIHSLFDNHSKVVRQVELTVSGYVSRTTSGDPRIAKTLKSHVKQMKDRLNDGYGVRRWDPAFNEFVNHYRNMDIKIRELSDGVEVTVTGKTREAARVAVNHAGIVSKFVKNGWDEHDVIHPKAAQNKGELKDIFALPSSNDAKAKPADVCPDKACTQCAESESGKCCGKCQTKSQNQSQSTGDQADKKDHAKD